MSSPFVRRSTSTVSVDGISHGNGMQEGSGISIRNRVSGDNIDVPRARVVLKDIDVTNFQKTGLLLDGNLTFSVSHAHVGQGGGPQGGPNPTIAANSLQISRGASGAVTDSTFKLNSHEQATGVLLHNAGTVDVDRVTVDGAAAATTGIDVFNSSHTIDTMFTMRGGAVTRAASPAAGTGIEVDVTGTYTANRPHQRRLRVVLQAFQLGANQTEGNLLRWTIKVDGRRVATIGQHAGDTDAWAQTFGKGTGTHTVEVAKNGVSQHIYQVHTR